MFGVKLQSVDENKSLPFYKSDFTGSLDALLKKANDINTVNREHVTFIESRKRQHQSTWVYKGEPLMKEKIAMDNFIDLKLHSFTDLIRVQDEYDKLLHQYSRILRNQPESRAAVTCIIHNLELLQVAIKEVHVQMLDVVDRSQSKTPSMPIDLDPLSDTKHVDADADHVFDNYMKYTFKLTSSKHSTRVKALEPYILNGKQHLACVCGHEGIKILDLSNKNVVATLRDSKYPVVSLAIYEMNGVPMLVSGSLEKSIQIWDLLSYSHIKTLSGHTSLIRSVITYQKDGKKFLVSGSADRTIKIWDLQDYRLIATLEGHRTVVRILKIFYRNGEPHLITGAWDRTIKLWCLNDFSLVSSFDQDVGEINCLSVVDCNDSEIIVSGDNDGIIKFWNMEGKYCIATVNAHSRSICTLDVLNYGEKKYLLSGSDDSTMKIWDVETRKLSSSFNHSSSVQAVRIFKKSDKPCLVYGGDCGNITLCVQ